MILGDYFETWVKEIPNLDKKLVTRFESGLIVDIQPPDLETRIAILQKEAQSGQVHIPDDVISYITQKTHQISEH